MRTKSPRYWEYSAWFALGTEQRHTYRQRWSWGQQEHRKPAGSRCFGRSIWHFREEWASAEWRLMIQHWWTCRKWRRIAPAVDPAAAGRIGRHQMPRRRVWFRLCRWRWSIIRSTKRSCVYAHSKWNINKFPFPSLSYSCGNVSGMAATLRKIFPAA